MPYNLQYTGTYYYIIKFNQINLCTSCYWTCLLIFG